MRERISEREAYKSEPRTPSDSNNKGTVLWFPGRDQDQSRSQQKKNLGGSLELRSKEAGKSETTVLTEHGTDGHTNASIFFLLLQPSRFSSPWARSVEKRATNLELRRGGRSKRGDEVL